VNLMNYDKWYRKLGIATIVCFLLLIISSTVYLTLPYIFCESTEEYEICVDYILHGGGSQAPKIQNIGMVNDITILFGQAEVFFGLMFYVFLGLLVMMGVIEAATFKKMDILLRIFWIAILLGFGWIMGIGLMAYYFIGRKNKWKMHRNKWKRRFGTIAIVFFTLTLILATLYLFAPYVICKFAIDPIGDIEDETWRECMDDLQYLKCCEDTPISTIMRYITAVMPCSGLLFLLFLGIIILWETVDFVKNIEKKLLKKK